MKPLIEVMCEKADSAMNKLLKVTDVVREQDKALTLSQNQVRCIDCKHHTLSPVQRYDEHGRSMGGCRLAHSSILYHDRILWTCPTFECREDESEELNHDNIAPRPPAEYNPQLTSWDGDAMKNWLEHWTRECSGVDRNERLGKPYCPECPFKPPCEWARRQFLRMLEERR